jgi:hypothetical protein
VTDLLNDAIAKLYAVPLGAFTRERDALAAALTKDKRADEARAVRQLRRPSAPLWATNQLAHAERDRLDAFLEGITQVRKTQLRDPRAAAEGLAQQRRELHTLVRRAGELLTEHGTRATPDAMRRISDTLLGAAVDGQRTKDLRHGRLTEELDAPGFEVLTGGGRADHLQLVKGGKATQREQGARREHAAQREHLTQKEHVAQQKEEAARQRRDAARERAEAAAREREEAAERKRQEAETRQREMAERRAAVEQADQEAKELKARLAAAQQRLAEARRAAKSVSRRRPT